MLYDRYDPNATVTLTLAELGCAHCRYAEPTGPAPAPVLCNGPRRLQIDTETRQCLSARSLLAKGLRYVHRSSPGAYAPTVRPTPLNSPSKH